MTIKRTNSNDADFLQLVMQLDNELWNELKEDQATYDQYNNVPDLDTAVVIYENDRPVAIGCYRKYNGDTVEIKRMFVDKNHRGRGFSKLILDELEDWAIEAGYQYSILETSIHFKPARSLYTRAGYIITENYDQYKGLADSVCMTKKLNKKITVSEFKGVAGIEYFDFEEDFVEKGIRCIPMIVRFKLDKTGIKLQLAEWNKFTVAERTELATKMCNDKDDINRYRHYTTELIKKYTGNEPTPLVVEVRPLWNELNEVPPLLIQKASEFTCDISVDQWKKLSDLQRFALLKLCRPGHENKNFKKAVKEFDLV